MSNPGIPTSAGRSRSTRGAVPRPDPGRAGGVAALVAAAGPGEFDEADLDLLAAGDPRLLADTTVLWIPGPPERIVRLGQGGGEPFLRRDLPEMIRVYFERCGFFSASSSFSTNSTCASCSAVSGLPASDT